MDLTQTVAKAVLKLLLFFVLASASCERTPSSEEKIQHYAVRGIVRGVSPDHTTIEIEHEAIPDFMPSMTMPFSVKRQQEIANLKAGDAVSFAMTVTAKDFWIEKVKKIGRQEVHLAESKPTATAARSGRLREGDIIPAFTLIDQEGRKVTFEIFRGRPVVLTFIFTRCPIPNFCPRISNNFAELQAAIKNNSELQDARLLSITLDPDFDTPRVLKGCGAHRQADPALWKFVTGDSKEIDGLTHAFSVYRQNEGGTISHGLVTALIDGDGRIVKLWRGNAWTPNEVLQELKLLLTQK